MLIDGRFYSEPELKSYIDGLRQRLRNSEMQNGVIEQLKQKNEELKSMLKQVASDLECYKDCMKDNCYVYCEDCIFNNKNKEEGCKYIHIDKIKKLIGGK